VSPRTRRLWLVLAGFGALVAGQAAGSTAARVAAGGFCLACGAALIALDGLRKRRGTRR
jgi:hypothetical protein